ncbi:MAG TPA: hypothetical protein V6C65_37380, partial [Allocoleopsis sp.]
AHLEHDLQTRKQEFAAKYGEEAANTWYEQAIQERNQLMASFENKAKTGDIATDQLLNAIFMVTREQAPIGSDKQQLIDALMKHLTSTEDT